MFEVVSAVLAAVMLLTIGFPKFSVPGVKPRKKTVGSSYWGLYEGAEPDNEDESRIEIPKPSRKWHVIAGSANYSTGKGISTSR